MFWKIIVLILIIAAILYLIGFFYCLATLMYFKRKIAKRVAALSIVYSEKREVLLALDEYFRTANMELDENDIGCVEAVRALKGGRLKEKDIMFQQETLSALEKRLRFKAGLNSWVKAGSDYETMISFLGDLNRSYRKIVAVYNSDLLGYEYWRKQPVYKYLFFIFGFRQKERIN